MNVYRLLSIFVLVALLAGCTPPAPVVPTTLPPTQPPTLLHNITPVPSVTPAPSATALPSLTPTAQPSATATESAAPAALLASGQLSLLSPFRISWGGNEQFTVAGSQGLAVYRSSGERVSFTPLAETDILLDISPDGKTLLTTSDYTTLELRASADGKTIETIQPGWAVTGAVFTPDGRNLALTSAEEIAVSLWDIAAKKVTRKLSGFETAAPVYNIAMSLDGKYLIWVARATVQLQEVSSEKFSPQFGHEDFVNALALAPDGGLLVTAAVGSQDGNPVPMLNFWDTASGKIVGRAVQTELPLSLSFSPDGKRLASTEGQNVLLWDVSKRTLIKKLDGAGAQVNYVAFSPDGRWLAAAMQDGAIRVWPQP